MDYYGKEKQATFMTDILNLWEENFRSIVENVLTQLQGSEHLFFHLIAERSQFTRFNHAKVRQSGVVTDGVLTITLVHDHRELSVSFPFTGNVTTDRATAQEKLHSLRQDILQIPPTPFAVIPHSGDSSREVYRGNLLDYDQAPTVILSPVSDLDFVGFYAGGQIVRASANSAGQHHWFATDAFFVDYSIFIDAETAIKDIYADREWSTEAYRMRIDRARAQLPFLSRPRHRLEKGTYRAYFSPAAVAELIDMIQGSVGEASLQQHSSALVPLWKGVKTLSPLFHLQENFDLGVVPRFNEKGELSDKYLPIITAGKLVNTLVSSRSEQEYHKLSNGATLGEYMRTPELSPGNLSKQDILTKLEEGVYLSQLHYLNWSDKPNGRITGMTRFACFWVEKGTIIAPISTMRFDDTLYSLFGENLEALTDFSELIPETGTYDHRSLGGKLVPGMLVSSFTFTL